MDLENYERVSVENVSLTNVGFVVFLKRTENSEVLPIFIGAAEAHSISAVLNNQTLPRPLSHDLFKNILDELECKVEQIFVHSLKEDTFYASIMLLLSHEKEIEIDSRPSDAIAMALRSDIPIYVHREVLKEAAVLLSEEEKMKQEGKSQLQVFQEAMEKAIQEERYEDAAKLRDQIKFIDKNN